MKIKTFFLSIIATLLTSPLYAMNDCVKHIADHHDQHAFLELDSCQLQDQDMPGVAAYLTSHPEIFQVELNKNNIGSEGARILANASTAAVIDLDDNHIGPEGAVALANNTHLKLLSAANNYIQTGGALALANSTTLQHINVANNDIEDAGIVALANMPALNWLGIAENHLGKAGIAALIHNAHIGMIDVSYTQANISDLLAFVTTRQTLYGLGVSGLHLGDANMKLLIDNIHADEMYEFMIADNDVTAASIAGIAAWNNLVILDVAHNHLGDSGMALLASSKTTLFANLYASENDISDEGAKMMAESIPYIVYTDLRYNRIGSVGREALDASKRIGHADLSFNLYDTNDALGINKNPIDSSRTRLGDHPSFAVVTARCAAHMNKGCFNAVYHLKN